MLDLPKVYENEGGKYPQHVGKPKLSYSAYNSFNEEAYKEYLTKICYSEKQNCIWSMLNLMRSISYHKVCVKKEPDRERCYKIYTFV